MSPRRILRASTVTVAAMLLMISTLFLAGCGGSNSSSNTITVTVTPDDGNAERFPDDFLYSECNQHVEHRGDVARQWNRGRQCHLRNDYRQRYLHCPSDRHLNRDGDDYRDLAGGHDEIGNSVCDIDPERDGERTVRNCISDICDFALGWARDIRSLGELGPGDSDLEDFLQSGI